MLQSSLLTAFKIDDLCSRKPFLLRCKDNKDGLSDNFYETLVLSTRGGASVKDDVEESDD